MVVDELVRRLEDKSVGTKAETIFQGSGADLPKLTKDSPPFLVLRCYAGMGPKRTHDRRAKPAYERPRVQVVAHGRTKAAAQALAQSAYDELPLDDDAEGGMEIGGVWYLRITPLQEPYDMGLDDAGRVMFGFNLETEKRPSA